MAAYAPYWTSAALRFPTGFAGLIAAVGYTNLLWSDVPRPGMKEISKAEWNATPAVGTGRMTVLYGVYARLWVLCVPTDLPLIALPARARRPT